MMGETALTLAEWARRVDPSCRDLVAELERSNPPLTHTALARYEAVEFSEMMVREMERRTARQWFTAPMTDAEMAAWYEQNGWRF